MDLVQITLLRALNRLEYFEARGEGAFLAYLSTDFCSTWIRDETRRAPRRARDARRNARRTARQVVDASSARSN
jgi:DNA-directed RNA polymerase specialized sigma24 family protein